MISIDGKTFADVFAEAASRYGANAFLCAPPAEGRDYHPEGVEFTYAEAAESVAGYAAALRRAGYGHGHRIALHVGNRPEHVLLKLAFNALGVSVLPINPDLRPAEIAYILQDSTPALAIVARRYLDTFAEAVAEAGHSLNVVPFEEMGDLPAAPTEPLSTPPHPQTEASLIYTSGTTGRPKGCIMGQEYELMMASEYAATGGLISIREGRERLYNPLPLFHVNAGIVSVLAMMLSGNCQVQPARFSASAWWPDIRTCRVTMVHYLGVVAPVLMAAPPGPGDRNHGVRVGVGAGVEPTLHRAFEARFGFPLVELWGMTEFCRVIIDAEEPRSIDTRAFGRPRKGLEARVVDENDRDVPSGTPGEMVLRHSAETPRKGAFSGYLNKPEATEEAWRGGWFHTGDTVTMDETGLLTFVDRKKNIIRRSGENIAAAEVEACIMGDARVAQVAVIAVPDPLRDEEVMACIVLKPEIEASPALAAEIFERCRDRLAYFKAPGWMLFVDALPVTGTQKVVKHRIFADGVDPTARPGIFDFTTRKRR
jgi:crotonobetaine/carnitine-CoA ligase